MNNGDKEYLIRKIRSRYTEKEFSDLDELHRLDREARRPARIFAWGMGTIGALVMGAGMSLVMTNLGTAIGITDPMVPGILIGAAGLAMTLANYPVYKRILSSRREKYAPRILELCSKLIHE